MAPPIPGLRQPVTIRPRTFGDVCVSVLAGIALLAVVIGVPVALVTVVGVRLPHTMPKLSALTSQLDVNAILHILEFLIWPIWAVLVWCILIEIKAGVSDRAAAPASRVPVAGSIAHRLVGAALLMFTAAAALTPAFSGSAAPAHPTTSISAQVTAMQGTQGERIGTIMAGIDGAHATHAPTSEKLYVVQPPIGRFHESLWEIAQKHLGDGRRYKEIFELNKDRVQPDGTKLTIASLIRPGWALVMPNDANGPGIEVVALHNNAAQSAEQVIAQGGSADGIVAAPAAQHQMAPVWPFELSSASLMAAGILVALGRRRREQLWRRAFGRRIAAPQGDAALAEQALRLGADDPAVRMLDTGLRHLAQQLGAQQRTPPTVFAAHVGTENLDLWVAPPDPNPPRPWQAADGGQVWRLPVAAVASLDIGNALAPYPGLVSLGTNETGRILVDLEVAHGLIAVRGSRAMVQGALAALAVELVTNQWSDRMRVTLVGFGAGLQNLSAERVSVLPSLDEALPELEARTKELAGVMAAAGIDSVLTGRAMTPDPDIWAPHYLIMGVPPTQPQVERLLALARGRHRMAAGYVIAGDVPGATWAWDVTDDGRLRADSLGFDLKAQLLAPEQYAAIVQLFHPDPGGIPLTPLGAGNAPAAHLAAGARMPVEVGLLGPATVQAPGMLEADRLALATELVVFLAAHPDGVHLNVVTGAIWPRGVSSEVRDSVLARVSAWLGTAPGGQGGGQGGGQVGSEQGGSEQGGERGGGEPNLLTDPSGRLRLGPGVRVDWQVFRTLLNRASQAAAASDARTEANCLEQALTLIRGQFLDGRDPSRYAWLATDGLEYEVTALVADAAHRLSALRLAAGEPAPAMEAARAGLRLAFNDEVLWRDLLLGAHATGREGVLRAAVAEISARVALDEVLPKMAPETEALIDELLPSWRTSAA
jgi:Bacterial transcriptional activator domain